MQSLERISLSPAFKTASRIAAVIGGIILVLITLVFYTKSPLARSIWPWDYTTLPELSYLFLASIFFAVAIPSLWIGITGELRPAAAGTIELAVILIPSGIFMLQSYAIRPNPRVLSGAIICLVMCAGLAFVYFTTRRIPYQDNRQMPRFLRNSLAFLVVALTIAGVLLVLKQPVFPWRLSGEASVIYGWIFLGAAVYFGRTVMNPHWSDASGQLGGFLAYDLVLIGPFLTQFSTVEPQYRLSLFLYTAIVIYSGALAVYYVFICPATRWRFGR